MAMKPDDAAAIAAGIRDMYTNAEAVILAKIAKATAKSADAPDWLTSRLVEQRRMITEVDTLLADLDAQVPGAVGRATDLAYNKGAGAANIDAKAAGIGMDVAGRVRDTGLDTVLARAAIEPLTGMRMQIRRWTNDTYSKVGLLAAESIASGVETRREASLKFLNQLAGKGVTGFVDRSGRSWEMGAYAEMVGRTTVAQAALEGHAERIQDLGVDTVIVSDSPEECSICAPFEGRVLSISGNTTGELKDGVTVMMSLSAAKSTGLYHPNCTHSHSIYLPGVTKREKGEKADPEGYALKQRQRAYERRVRELRREDAIAQEFGGSEAVAARQKLNAKRAEFREWRNEHDRKPAPGRTNVTAR